MPVINRLAAKFANVILTQDWHPPGHVSFASTHPGRRPFETIELPYGAQVLWPDHCVQGSRGAEFAATLAVAHAQAVIRKGYHAHTDSYSALLEADRVTPTGLAGLLRERGVRRVFLCGLATDFCVAWSALDASAAGFEAVVIEDACRASTPAARWPSRGAISPPPGCAWSRPTNSRRRATLRLPPTSSHRNANIPC